MAREKGDSKLKTKNSNVIEESYAAADVEQRTRTPNQLNTANTAYRHSPQPRSIFSTKHKKLNSRVNKLKHKVNHLLIKDQKWKLKFKALELEIKEIKLQHKQAELLTVISNQNTQQLQQTQQVQVTHVESKNEEPTATENETAHSPQINVMNTPIRRQPPSLANLPAPALPSLPVTKGGKASTSTSSTSTTKKFQKPDQPKPKCKKVQNEVSFSTKNKQQTGEPSSKNVEKKKTVSSFSSSSSDSSDSSSDSSSEDTDSDATVQIRKEKTATSSNSKGQGSQGRQDLFDCPLSNGCIDLFTKPQLEKHMKEKHNVKSSKK